MKQFSCHIITIIFLVGCVSFYQDFTYAATDIEIHGQIGGNEAQTQESKELESEIDTKLAQPKQVHIGLKKFPVTGSIIEKFTPIGLVVLLLYILLSRWKAYKKK